MANPEEQQAAESRPHIDPVLVIEVISQTRSVNENLGSILNRTDTVIRRQNLLTFLFIILLVLNSLHLALGLSMQQLQESAKTQLNASILVREELLVSIKEAKQEVKGMREALGTVRTQLQSVPTVTTDSKGRINLEVPLDTAAQKTVADQPQVSGDARAPDKLVIPLRTSQSRLSN